MKKSDHPQQIHMDGSTRQQRLYDGAIDLLRMTCPPEGFYLATSFGKDSIVAHRLCDEAGVKYDAHNNHTSVDPPELVHFGRKYYPEVERDYPGISMWRLIEKKGIPPTRIMRYCCDVLKEDGGKDRVCVMGLRAAESSRRAKRWAPVAEYKPKHDRAREAIRLFEPDDIIHQVQHCGIRGKWTVSPLYHWQDGDLWDFIRDRKLPYCELYDQGFPRLGCIGCPMVRPWQRERDFKRFPTYRTAYIHAFDRMLAAGKFNKNGNMKCGEDVMRWWMAEPGEKELAGQVDEWEYEDLEEEDEGSGREWHGG